MKLAPSMDWLRLLPLLVLVSCGSNDDSKTVTLLTGLESPTQFKNLMNGFTTPQSKIIVPNTACAQANLVAGFKVGEDDFNVRTVGVRMVTPFTGTGGTLISQTNPSLWITNNATFDPIQLQVPAGLVDFGVVGTIVDPTGSTGGGTCREMDASNIVPMANLSVLGHKKINVSENTILPLNVWIQNPLTTPSPSPGGSNLCAGENTQQCPDQNFFRVLCVGTDCASPYRIKFEYALNGTGSPQVTQWRDGTNSIISIPDIQPLRVTLTTSSLSPRGSVLFTRDDFTNQTAVKAVPSTNATVGVVKNGATLGTPSVTAQQINCGVNTGDILLTWPPVQGAVYYAVYSGTSSGTHPSQEATNIVGTSYTVNVTASGGPIYLVVKATNGSTVTTSPEVGMQVVGLGAPSISVAGSGDTFQVTAISTFTGMSSCQVYGGTTNSSFPYNLGAVTGAGGPAPGPTTLPTPGNYYPKLVCTSATGGVCSYIGTVVNFP